MNRKPVWLIRPLGLDTVRNAAASMEVETRQFYEKAAARTGDAHIRQLLDDLAQEERSHETRAEQLEEDKLGTDVRMKEDEANRRLFVLQIVQPGLAGLMDGSVSTLAPVFAAAFATHKSVGRFPGRPGGFAGRGHQHGLRGSAFRRRQPDRPRPPLDARPDLRPDDHPRRHRPHAAVSHSKLYRGHDGGHRGSGRGAGA